VVGDDQIIGARQALEQLNYTPKGRRIPAHTRIAKGYARISHESPPPGAFHCAPAEDRTEFLLRKRSQPLELGSKQRNSKLGI
jgi:hypothetical protein